MSVRKTLPHPEFTAELWDYEGCNISLQVIILFFHLCPAVMTAGDGGGSEIRGLWGRGAWGGGGDHGESGLHRPVSAAESGPTPSHISQREFRTHPHIILSPRSSSDPGAVSKAPPGAELDQTAGLMVSQQVVHKLLARDDLLSPQQHLQMYDSPLDISIDFGKRRLSHQTSNLGTD